MIHEKNPWKTKSVREVYNNPWITVEHHEVITPAGAEGIYGKVHMKNFAMGIIPLDDELNTWLVGQYRYTLERYSWEIPMGGGPIEKDPLVSAKRELQEETGLAASSWTKVLEIHTSNCITDEWGAVYLAEGIIEGTPNFDDTEDILIKKLPFNQAFDMVMNGEITDSISIAGILKLKLILNH